MEPNRALRFARQERGWSQAELATHVETSAKVVSRWERGTACPSPYFRTKLCQLFSTTAHAIGIVDPPASPVHLQRENADMPQQGPLLQPRVSSALFSSTHVVGRDAVLQRVLTALSPGHTCALYGLPGVGKTTLAQVIAHHEAIQTHFPDGVLWVGLGPSPDIVSTLMHWATSLAVSQEAMRTVQTGEAMQTLVQQALSRRRVLLVIDDAWTSDAVLPFLLGGPQCGHLLTTRFPQIALLVTDETPFLVSELNEQETTHLLTTLVPMLRVEDPTPLQQAWRMTGGLPLAVTLISKYLRLHAYGGQPRRLHAALASLSDAHMRLHLSLPSVLAMKHSNEQKANTPSSLDQVIALSDEALSPRAQEAFRALSVLPTKPDSFSEEAALAVSGDRVEDIDTLCDAGLLESFSPGRYTLHQVIAEYARLHLKGTVPAERLLHYALERSKNQRDLARLAEDHSTLLAALHSPAVHDNPQEYMTLIQRLTTFWRIQGHTALAEREMSHALEVARETQNISWTIRLLCDLAQCLFLRGEVRGAEMSLAEACDMARQQDHPALLALALHTLGTVSYIQGKLETAERCFQESLVLARHQGETERVGKTLTNLGAIAASRGKWSQAQHYWQERLQQARMQENQEAICLTLESLGRMAVYTLGGEAEAQRYLQEALEIAETLVFHMARADIRRNFGELAYVQGHIEQAEQYNQEGLSIAREFQQLRSLLLLLEQAASLALAREQDDQADVLLDEAEPLAQGNAFLLGLVRCRKGKVRLVQHRFGEAQRLLEDALTTFATDEEEFRARAEYVLAQVHAAQGNIEEAKHLGEQSLARYTSMQHRETVVVRAWILNHVRTRRAVSHVIPHEERGKPSCPHCHGHNAVVKRGKSRSGAQRYRCTQCRRDFSRHVPL